MTEPETTRTNLSAPWLLAGEPGRGDTLSLIVSLFADAPLAVAVLEGSQLVHRWANARWLTLLGRELELSEILDKPLDGVVPDGESELLAIAQHARLTGRSQRFEELCLYGTNGDIWLSGVAVPMGNRVVFQVHDITRQVLALKELQHAGSFADEVLEQIPYPVVVLSPEGEVLRANNKARTRHCVVPGQSAKKLLSVLELRHENGRPMRLKDLPMRRTLDGETVEMRGSIRDRLLGERRDCVFYGGPVLVGGQMVAALASSIDVTELRRLERAKDEFLNIAAHELKTPLTAVRAYLQLAVRKGLDTPQARTMVDSAVAGTYRMQRLIADMLDSARIETGRLRLQIERCDLAQVVGDCEERYRRHLDGERSIELQIDGPLQLDGDPVRLDQIVGNLLSNALRHGPPGKPVYVRARRDGGCALVEVEDLGDGIAPEDVPRLFERLFRGATAKGDGLGLGLFIAKELAELHGGHLGVDPGPGRGARFFLRLPLLG